MRLRGARLDDITVRSHMGRPRARAWGKLLGAPLPRVRFAHPRLNSNARFAGLMWNGVGLAMGVRFVRPRPNAVARACGLASGGESSSMESAEGASLDNAHALK